MRQLVHECLDRILTDRAASAIQAIRELFARPHGGLLTLASLLGLYGLSRGFVAVIRALDLAYDLEERRSFLHQRLTALLLALSAVAMAIVLLAMIVVGPLLGGGRALAEVVGVGPWFAAVWSWLRWPFAFALLVAWASVLYRVAPFRRAGRPRRSGPAASGERGSPACRWTTVTRVAALVVFAGVVWEHAGGRTCGRPGRYRWGAIAAKSARVSGPRLRLPWAVGTWVGRPSTETSTPRTPANAVAV